MLSDFSLAEQQGRLQALLLDPDRQDATLLASGPGLAAYRHAYRARMLAALRDNYTVLHQALGDQDFDALGLAFLAAQPSRQPSIRWFGDGLAAFMAGPYAAHLPHPAHADLARLDWALRHAFDAADDAPLSLASLAALQPEDWPTLRLRPRASVQLLRLNWNIAPAWRALLRQHEDGTPAELDAPEPLAHRMLVWRRALDTQWRALPVLEGELIALLTEGADFAALCACAAASLDDEAEAASTVVAHLQRWLAEGWLLE